MKQLFKGFMEYLQQNKEDFEYLLFVGVPTGILLVILHEHLDFTNLF